jgi:hypothetical protein
MTTDDPTPDDERPDRQSIRKAWEQDRLEIIATILLSIATLFSAWGAYQASRWGSTYSSATTQAASLRAQGNQQSVVADRNLQIDVATFIAWSGAIAADDQALAEFLSARFRAEFVPAWQAWRDSVPAGERVPAGTPFDRPEYVLAAQVAADDLFARSEASTADATQASAINGDYVRATLIFAIVLFFAGMATRLKTEWARRFLVGVAAVAFGIGVLVEVSLPRLLSF